jgi:hypothetical protein
MIGTMTVAVVGDALTRLAPLVVAALLLASCSSGWIEPPAERPSLDEHCILHSIAELDARSDRLISQARSAANMELQRTAETMAFGHSAGRRSIAGSSTRRETRADHLHLSRRLDADHGARGAC